MDEPDRTGLERRLAAAGFIAARAEARQLWTAAGRDPARLACLVERRLAGEPLAWIVGRASFGGVSVVVGRGVYVPRAHSEHLARRAVELLPARGRAIDVCTGSGALGRVLVERRRAELVATDIDPIAVACARANGLDARVGDLLEAVPDHFHGTTDLLIGVVPYVPTAELGLLQRDTFAHESGLAYDGGPDGTRLLRRAVEGAGELLRAGGWVVLELGGDQAELLGGTLEAVGFDRPDAVRDEDGELRGIAARLGG